MVRSSAIVVCSDASSKSRREDMMCSFPGSRVEEGFYQKSLISMADSNGKIKVRLAGHPGVRIDSEQGGLYRLRAP